MTPSRGRRLTVVPRTAGHTPKVPFVVLVLLVLGGGLVGLLVLNTSLQQGAFYEASLQDQQNALATQREDLRLKIAALRDPQRLAREAHSLGMVPNTSPVFIDLRDGSVIGDPQPAIAATDLRLSVGREQVGNHQAHLDHEKPSHRAAAGAGAGR
jgi:hypothetical protein